MAVDLRTNHEDTRSHAVRPEEVGVIREQLHTKLGLFEENNRWFFWNEERLREKYLGQLVAVENGKVIAAGADYLEILKRLKARPGD